jgi:transcription factor IIIB 90 kDa subunit
MHEFIKALSARLGHPGLAARAAQIFDMGMDRGRFRWRRKAKLTAAAGIAIACREAHKADPLRDLAVACLFHVIRLLSGTHGMSSS